MSGGEHQLGGLTVVGDVTEVPAVDWITQAAHGWGVVHALVPDVFDAYARIFHPAYRDAADDEVARADVPTYARLVPGTNVAMTVARDEVCWSEVAAANGRIAHPAMEWTSITGSYDYSWGGQQPGLWSQVPVRGTLPLRHTKRLCELLCKYTSTPERCWFAIWEGYGDLPEVLRDGWLPGLEMKHRSMVLVTGPLARLPETSFEEVWYSSGWRDPACGYRSPSLWWPEDRAWCVASDVDLQTTYLGASADCVAELLADEQLEVSPVAASQSVMIEADTINPEPAGAR